jgi:hypothetical protein
MSYKEMDCKRKKIKDIANRKWRNENKEKVANYQRKYRKQNPQKYINLRLKWTYGISIEEYNEMFLKQNGLCAICKRTDIEQKRLAVDHCHKTGKIRELLCSKCNKGLGHFDDNLIYLKEAVEYLKKYE